MQISNHTLSEHVRLLSPLFLLVACVWLLRIILDAGEVPAGVIALFSVTVSVAISVVLAAIIIHVREFGGYGSVILSAILLVTWGQLLIVLAIIFSVFTGIPTVYTDPRYSLRSDPLHIHHVVGHLTIGIGSGILVGSLMGCFLLYFLRTYGPEPGE